MAAVLEVTREGRLLRITLNRPEKRNALNLELCGALVTAIEAAEADPEVGAILLTGNGKVFCAGMDLNEVLSSETGAIDMVHERLFTVGYRVTKPIVAAVHGPALAGGCGLVANAHVVVAADDATFGLTEIRLGLWPFVIFRPVALAVGERRAVELSLTGRIFDAREAQQLGLAHYVVPAAEMAARAGEVAAALSNASAAAVRGGLAFVREIRGRDWQEAGEIAQRARQEVFHSPEFREGIRVFREKRRPAS